MSRMRHEFIPGFIECDLEFEELWDSILPSNSARLVTVRDPSILRLESWLSQRHAEPPNKWCEWWQTVRDANFDARTIIVGEEVAACLRHYAPQELFDSVQLDISSLSGWALHLSVAILLNSPTTPELLTAIERLARSSEFLSRSFGLAERRRRSIT